MAPAALLTRAASFIGLRGRATIASNAFATIP